MLRKVMSFAVVVVVVTSIALTGCDLFSSGETAYGRVQVLLTDEPLEDFDEVHVVISRVELLGGDEGVYILADEPQTFDLLTLQDGVTELLADAEVPEGKYHQLRLIVDDEAEVLMKDGSTVKIPSGQQTGIKVVFKPFEIENDGDLIELTVDFDVNHSFVKSGASGMYTFKPVLKAQAMVVNGESIELGEEEV